jgi:PKHD-type hydroxylase
MPATEPVFHFTYTAWADAFTPAELDAIEAYGDRLSLSAAPIVGQPEQTGGKLDQRSRITRTAWIERNPETLWLYDRMQQVIGRLNSSTYQFDLRGFSDPFQYTVYHGDEGGHYDWHIDQGPTGEQRKLSISLQLTDPARYGGCELEFFAGKLLEIAPKERGTMIAFPSYTLHRVTPIVSGTRKSVVVWVTGPKFK